MLRTRVLRTLTVDAPRGEGGGRFIAAASGLVRTGDHLYVIADDERELGVFPAAGNAPGRLVRFLPGDLPADPDERKRSKPDVEALALLPRRGGLEHGALLALESGSREQRREGVLWALDERGGLAGEPRHLDLRDFYGALDRDIPDLNVEGATVVGDRLVLFQRGNGPAGVNAAVDLDLEAALAGLEEGGIPAAAVAGVRRYDLGEVDGVPLCFSDATGLPDGRVVFTAVAERGRDTYHDGGLAGAGVGMLDRSGDPVAWDALEPAVKVEGVEAHPDGDAVELLLVADADDPASPSPLLGARIEPPAGA